MDAARTEHLRMIQEAINRMATCSFQLKGWAVTLAAALEVFLQGGASPGYLFVPTLPVVAFWLLDAWYLRQERLFRRLFDNVRTQNSPADFSMDTNPFRVGAPSLLTAAGSPTLAGFYGPVLAVAMILAFVLPA